jgi:hypothetical protein
MRFPVKFTSKKELSLKIRYLSKIILSDFSVIKCYI